MGNLTPDNLTDIREKTRLFSIGQVSVAAAFGGPFAGGWLLYRNVDSTSGSILARRVLFISIGILVAISILFSYLPTDFPNNIGPAIIGGGYYFWYKHVFDRQYSEHIESGLEKASNWKVALAVVIGIPVAIIVMVIVSILVPIVPMNYVAIGQNFVYYEGGADRDDATRLGQFLTDQGVFDDVVGWEFGVEIPRGRLDEVLLKASIEAPKEVSDTYFAIQELVGEAESQLYPNKNVTFEVLNEFGITVMRIEDD